MGDSGEKSNKPVIKSPQAALQSKVKQEVSEGAPHLVGNKGMKGDSEERSASAFHKVTKTSPDAHSKSSSIRQLQLKYKASKEESMKHSLNSGDTPGQKHSHNSGDTPGQKPNHSSSDPPRQKSTHNSGDTPAVKHTPTSDPPDHVNAAQSQKHGNEPHVNATRVQEILHDDSLDTSGEMSPRPPDEPKAHTEIHHGGLHHNMHTTENSHGDPDTPATGATNGQHTPGTGPREEQRAASGGSTTKEPQGNGGMSSPSNAGSAVKAGLRTKGAALSVDHVEALYRETSPVTVSEMSTEPSPQNSSPLQRSKSDAMDRERPPLLHRNTWNGVAPSNGNPSNRNLTNGSPSNGNTSNRSPNSKLSNDNPTNSNPSNGNPSNNHPSHETASQGSHSSPPTGKSVTVTSLHARRDECEEENVGGTERLSPRDKTDRQPSPRNKTEKQTSSQDKSEKQVSPRERTLPTKGPMKAPSSKPDDSPSPTIPDAPDDLSLTLDGAPEPAQQREIIAQVSTECTCTYAVLKLWYRRWEDYVGVHNKGGSAGGEPPGPVEMDNHNDANNDYISEEAWKHLIKWYGISETHQLDRKHLYFKDEKMFDVCTLSPFSGIVEHTVKKFNRFEEIGYIECQLRRVFHVSDHKRTRMWISEKAQVPRFRQLLLRFRMLNDCIHRDKMYILALEEGLSGGDGWPTGEPGEAKGELTKYSALVTGYKADDHWSTHIEASLDTLSVSLGESLRSMSDAFMRNGRDLIKERETQLVNTRRVLENKLDETKQKEKFLDEKTKEVSKQEEKLRQDRHTLLEERAEFETREKKFREEVEMMERINKIQETKVKLDIGGQIHTTSLQTLRKDPESMLASMFSGRHTLHKESDGSYFIDRDHSYFRYILNFLRDGTIEQGTLPTKVYALREILREARYYQLSGLVNFLEEIIQERSSGSSS